MPTSSQWWMNQLQHSKQNIQQLAATTGSHPSRWQHFQREHQRKKWPARHETKTTTAKRERMQPKTEVQVDGTYPRSGGVVTDDADGPANTPSDSRCGGSPPAGEHNPGDVETTCEAAARSHHASAPRAEVDEKQKVTRDLPWTS
ncbi:hypothetical protein ON010_g18232 [Phytophthora cinnamomi]|nr:hypothetical protein ON010_g18232 [Phytophthora cinnamomi]